MLSYRVHSSRLSGEIAIPPSKSHTLRAIVLATLARGVSHIDDYLHSPDTHAMLQACRLFGAEIDAGPQRLTIRGVAGKPQTPTQIIDAGNSGQVLRFISALAALCDGYTVITGDESIRTNRPIQPLIDGLTGLGVFAVSTRGNGFAPVVVKGPLLGGETCLSGYDSQPVSGLLLAAAFAPNPTRLHVLNPGETPWIELTLDWLKRIGIHIGHRDYCAYDVPGRADTVGFKYRVPGDFSSCAFPLAAACVTQSSVVLSNLDFTDVQGDKLLIATLQAGGADIVISQAAHQLQVRGTGSVALGVTDVNQMIDALPILAVLACFAPSETRLINAGSARHKECDRLAVITRELRKMGADIDELTDGLIIRPAKLMAAHLTSHADHRIAMALTVAALAVEGESVIHQVDCVEKSYPHFARTMQTLGARLEVC